MTSLDLPLVRQITLASDVLDDTERVLIANENRLRQMTRTEVDSDGEQRGFGMSESDPDVARLAALVEMLRQVEHNATLNLQRLVRRHHLHEWQEQSRGIGPKQLGRLLGTLYDPYFNVMTGEPRTVSQLWSYCGHGDASRKIRRGISQEELFALGNPHAKMRTFLIATSCLKAGGSYRDVYDERREQTEFRLHATECKRCGPSGHPAAPGTPWSKAHQHADGLRIMGKAILKDMWSISRDFIES